MNTFKLLSSSTSLSKKRNEARGIRASASTAPISTSHVPSRCQPQDEPPAKKRKVGEQPNATHASDIDFFDNGASNVSEGASVKERSSAGATDREVVAAESIPKLGQEDCKKLLKDHKLRVTKLWDPHVRQKHKSSSDDETSKKKAELYPQPLQSYAHLRAEYDVSSRLTANLDKQGYQTPTEVQMAGLPLLLNEDEEIDLLSIAPTGSGKTLAFLIPLVHKIIQMKRSLASEEKDLKGTQAVVLAPTKELARQIVNEARKLIDKTGVKVTLVKKGMRLAQEVPNMPSADEDDLSEDQDSDQVEEEKSHSPDAMIIKSHILVSTPGVFANALTSSSTQSLQIRYLVLDEADVLLDPLFRDQTLQIWSSCINPSLRTSLWSATMGASIEQLARSTILARYETLEVPQIHRNPFLRLVVGLKDSALPSITHKLTYCATESGKLLAMRQLLHPTTSSNGPILRPPFLVFTQTIPRAIALHSELKYDIPIAAGGSSRIAVLHAELSDTARDSIMSRFRRGEVWVLITTDLLSRGVDFRGVNGVVNYDFPGSSAAYIHRVGRAGRAGREGGVAVTLYDKEDVGVLGVVVNVIRASEKQRELKKGGNGHGEETKGMDQWLVDLLPKVSKRDRQALKKKGIESRKRGDKRSRISTKSGYQRKLEHRRKERVESRTGASGKMQQSDDAEFRGFDD